MCRAGVLVGQVWKPLIPKEVGADLGVGPSEVLMRPYTHFHAFLEFFETALMKHLDIEAKLFQGQGGGIEEFI